MVWADAGKGTEETMTIAEVRCPGCHKLLVKNFEGQAELYCKDCHLEITLKQRLPQVRSLFSPGAIAVVRGA